MARQLLVLFTRSTRVIPPPPPFAVAAPVAAASGNHAGACLFITRARADIFPGVFRSVFISVVSGQDAN